jgi:hypothetical protein
MKFLVYFQKDCGYGWNPCVIFQKILENLIKKYPQHKFKFIDSSSLKDPATYGGPSNQYSNMFFRIENEENNKYFLISYWDIIKDIFIKEYNSGFIIENLIELFTSIGVQEKNDDSIDRYLPCSPPIKYTPISFSHTLIKAESTILELNKKITTKQIPQIPKFRGFCMGFRKHLKQDRRFNIIDTNQERLSIEDFLQELNNDKINLSFNGIGEISHRDIDILGLGNVLLRPKLAVKFHNDLIPEYHYASVEVEDQADFKTFSDAFIEKYNKIKKDKDYLDFISHNGKAWYSENGTAQKNSEIICKLIDLNKLCNQ